MQCNVLLAPLSTEHAEETRKVQVLARREQLEVEGMAAQREDIIKSSLTAFAAGEGGSSSSSSSS